MSINWTLFENRLIDYVRSHKAKNEDELADRIASEYNAAIKTGTNQYSEFVLKANRDAMASALKSGFKVAKLTNNPNDAQRAIKTMFAVGVISYWTGGMLGLAPPPPGTIGSVSNTIINPGIPPTLLVGNTDSPETMIKLMSVQLKIHANTVAGTTIALVNVSGVPTPTPFPWVGIK